MESAEILVQEEGNLVARYRNVLIQIRSGAMTASVLDRIENGALLMRASSGGPVGAIAILEEGASLAGPAVRNRQMEVLRSLLSDPRTHLSSVVLGDSIGTRALRTFMRLALLGKPRVHAAATVDEAIDWLCKRLGTPTRAELRAAIATVRAKARDTAA